MKMRRLSSCNVPVALMATEESAASRLKHIASALPLSGVLGCLPARGYAAGLDCPEFGPPRTVPNLLTDVQTKLVASGNGIDLANEIYDLINKLQIEKSNISYADLADILIAAYCPVIANLANLTALEHVDIVQHSILLVAVLHVLDARMPELPLAPQRLDCLPPL